MTSNTSDRPGDPYEIPYRVELRPKQDFYLEPAKQKLADLHLMLAGTQGFKLIIPDEFQATADGDDEGSGRHARALQLPSWISTESRVTVYVALFWHFWLECLSSNALQIGCAGAIMNYLQRRRASRFLPGDPAADTMFCISAIEMTTLKETMYEASLSKLSTPLITSARLLNEDTLSSLQIMQLESHPSSHNQGPTKASSGSKESLSVYGLFHHLTHTKQGRHMLRQYFLRPSMNINLINERLDSVATFIRPDNLSVVTEITRGLKQVANARTLVVNLRKGTATGCGQGGRISKSTWSGLQMVCRESH